MNELLAFGREGVDADGRIVRDVAEGPVDLGVGGHAALAEGLDDSIEADLAVHLVVDDGGLCWASRGRRAQLRLLPETGPSVMLKSA